MSKLGIISKVSELTVSTRTVQRRVVEEKLYTIRPANKPLFNIIFHPKYVTPRIMHGKISVFLLGSFSRNGVNPLHFIREEYKSLHI